MNPLPSEQHFDAAIHACSLAIVLYAFSGVLNMRPRQGSGFKLQTTSILWAIVVHNVFGFTHILYTGTSFLLLFGFCAHNLSLRH